VTKDGLVIMASESGVLDIPPENDPRKGRLQPGRMFLVDTEQGRIIEDEEIKQQVANERPYRQWLNEHLVHLEDLPTAPSVPVPDHETLLQRQIAFGYTFEDQRIMMTPMAPRRRRGHRLDGQRHAARRLSNKPRLLYDYFKQLFAQVTNPPIDCIREEIVTAAETLARLRGQPAQAAAGGLPPRRAEVARSSPTRSSPRSAALTCPASRPACCPPVPRRPRREGSRGRWRRSA
jgi:hypothetical protein